ncbi:glycosyltransferase 87 family protein [Arenibacter certesii]|uniref:glycosyltransferase 87 family protein n=1 Tax=Arenibacter certesii TaxID=228955 RepID=UPI0003FBB1ED|nr:glycosyltransferase 87 family protein [Arenibacter certesii]
MIDKAISYWKLHTFPILMVLTSLLFYSTFGYHLPRTDFIKLISLYFALFFLCYKLIQFEKWNFTFLIVSGTLFRMVFLFSEPNLSQDFYRFVWDGQLIINGINPYLHLPKDLVLDLHRKFPNAMELYNGMGDLSASNYSNYPPLNQLIFALSALLTGNSTMGSIIIMRIIIILADLGILYYGRKLLKKLNKSSHLIFWYFLNPLVILELTGNLHFEGVMLFFFICSLYLLNQNKWILAAVVYALSISIKLVPLMFLPLFLKYLGLKRSMMFYVLVGGVTLLLALPFYAPEFISNYSQTIGLWFSNFEFNASIYKMVKYIGVQWDAKPWELIKTYGKIIPIIIIAWVGLITYIRNNKNVNSLITSMLWILSLYYFLSATVHPWYIIFLVLLGLFSKFRFPLLWSLTIFLSYFAYSNAAYKESGLILILEYIVIYGFMFYEISRLQVKNQLFHKNSL